VDSARDLYFLEGIRYLPRVLELVDRNRLSSTYGCFDRSFWHYRTSDFPSGMYQEAVLPLALAYQFDHPQNKFFHQDRVKELAWAGIDYARRSSHTDGSCDDYFPFERAAGATAFSLYACTEASLLLKFSDSAFFAFFKKRANYLNREGYNESGTLSNHKALMILTLYNVFLLTGDSQFKKNAEERLGSFLSLQTGEGWFPEYQGCDPGYLSFAIDFLAKYYQKSKDEKVLEPLRRAVHFASYFLHPDGSYGGEYGSRNTFHFLPHGLEILAGKIPEALSMSDRFLGAIKNETRSYIEDDRIFCHYVYNFLQAAADFSPRQGTGQIAPREELKFFKEAGLLVKNSKNHYVVLSTAKGGVGKIFKEGKLSWSDCGLVGKTADGKTFVSQALDDFKPNVTDTSVTVEGFCREHGEVLFSPVSFLLFRVFLLTMGRFLPANVTRAFLQKKAILKNKKKFPLHFKKTYSLESPFSLEIILRLENPGAKIKELWIGSDPTFIYVATSQPYQSGNLKKWTDLSGLLPELHKNRMATFRLRVA